MAARAPVTSQALGLQSMQATIHGEGEGIFKSDSTRHATNISNKVFGLTAVKIFVIKIPGPKTLLLILVACLVESLLKIPSPSPWMVACMDWSPRACEVTGARAAISPQKMSRMVVCHAVPLV
jgi:hypothetical protein